MIFQCSKICFILGFITVLSVSCITEPGFSDNPELEFVSLSKNTLEQGVVNNDSLIINFVFTDGNGDIGSDRTNIFLTDNRRGQPYGNNFRVEPIPPDGASKGIEGEVALKIFTTCCFFPDNIPPCESPPQFPTDTLSIDIHMEDRAGNMSNIITTENIILLCN